MIAASTGACFLPSASPAARPSSTTSTRSLTPAPTESMASSVAPFGFALRRLRLHQQQLRAFELRTLVTSRRPCRPRARGSWPCRDPRLSSDRRCRRCRHRSASPPDETENSLPCRARRTRFRRPRRRPNQPPPAGGRRPCRRRRSAARSSSVVPANAGIFVGGDDVANHAGHLHNGLPVAGLTRTGRRCRRCRPPRRRPACPSGRPPCARSCR